MTKVTLLWIGGWSMPDTVWDGLRMELPECDHLTVSYGHVKHSEEFVIRARLLAESAAGNHSSPGCPADPTTFAADRLERVRRAPLIAVGWSLGGLVAQRLAASGHADAIVLLGSTARFVRDRTESSLGWSDRSVRQMITALEQTGHRAQVMQQFNRMVFTDEERRSGADQGFPVDGRWSDEALLAGLHYLRQEDMRFKLANSQCPAFIMHGTADSICPWKAAEELNAMIPGSQLVPVYGAGHVLFLGRENSIADAIRRMIHAFEQKLDPTTL